MKINQTAALIIFLLVHTAVLFHFHNRFWCAADDGQLAHVAQRIHQGEVLFRDVHDSHPGYIHWLNALAMRLFGEDFVSLRYPVVGVFFIIGCLVFLHFSPHNLFLGILAGLSPTVLSFVHYIDPNHHWYALSLTFLTGIVLSRPALDKRRQIFIAGVLIAAIYLFRQLTGVFVSMAAVSYFLMEVSVDRPAKSDFRRAGLFYSVSGTILAGTVVYLLRTTDLFGLLVFGAWPILLIGWIIKSRSAANRDVGERLKYFFAGMAAGFLPLLIQQLLQGTLAAWFEHSVIRALYTYQNKFLWNYNYSVLFQAAWRNIIQPQNLTQFFNSFYWIILFSLPIVNGILLLRYLRRQSVRNISAVVFPLLAVFYSIVAVHFQIPVYLYFTTGLTVVAVMQWLIVLKPRLWIWRLAAGLFSFLLAVALYFHAAQPLTRSFYALLSGVKFPAVWAAGELKRTHLWIDREDFQMYTRIIRAVEERSQPEDPIFVLPYNPEIYFISGRKNIFPFFINDFQSKEDYVAIRAQLEQTPPKLVIYAPDNKRVSELTASLMNYIVEKYSRTETIGDFEVYDRKN